MAKSKNEGSLIGAIEKALKKELESMGIATDLSDKLSIIDRAIKFETLRAKRQDAGLGSGFADDDDDDN